MDTRSAQNSGTEVQKGGESGQREQHPGSVGDSEIMENVLSVLLRSEQIPPGPGILDPQESGSAAELFIWHII